MSKKLFAMTIGIAFSLLFVGSAVIGDEPPPIPDGPPIGLNSGDLPAGVGGETGEVGPAQVVACLKACKAACDRFAPPGPPRVACYAACVPFCWQFLYD